MTQHSPANLTSMVRAYIKSGRAKTHNQHYVKLSTQDVACEANPGTRSPHLRHDLLDLRKTTPSPPPRRLLLWGPHRTIFRKTMKGLPDAQN